MVKRDGMEVSVSSHEAEAKDIKKDMQNGEILHISDNLPLSSEWSLTKAPVKPEGPDLVPTSDNVSSDGKVNTLSTDKQTESAESSEAYTITATTYTNKKGKTSDVWLVKSGRGLSKEEKSALDSFSREPLTEGKKTTRGWYDHKQEGYMMRSEEAARQLGEMLGNEEAVADAQPLSREDIRQDAKPTEKPARKKSAPKPSELTLSEESDHNNLSFLTASDGTTTFGVIREGEGIQAGVIKLSLGFDRIVKVDGNDVHRGYGYEHIDAQRGDVIRAACFRTVADFVEYVSKNYVSIKKGSKRNGKDTFIIEVPQTDDKDANILYIELSADKEYWNVNSGGIFRSGYTKNMEVIEKKEKTDNSLPALETSPATGDGKVQDTSEGGNLLSGNSSLSESSERKVTNATSDKQGDSTKSSRLLTGNKPAQEPRDKAPKAPGKRKLGRK